jgi:hypothetical protein
MKENPMNGATVDKGPRLESVNHGEKVDLSTWNLDTLDDVHTALNDVIKRAATEAVRIACDDKLHAYFPNDWNCGGEPSDGIGGRPPSDPTTIYISLPFGAHEDGDPTWKTSVSALVDYTLEGCTGVDGKVGDDQRECIQALRDGLMAAVAKIDRTL